MTDTQTTSLSDFLYTDAATDTAAESIAGVYGAAPDQAFGETVALALAEAAENKDAGWLDTDEATRVARAAAGECYTGGYDKMFAMCALMDLRKAYAAL